MAARAGNSTSNSRSRKCSMREPISIGNHPRRSLVCLSMVPRSAVIISFIIPTAHSFLHFSCKTTALFIGACFVLAEMICSLKTA